MQTILVVEDDHIVRFATVEMMEAEGYAVLEATHAEEAIAILERRTDIRTVVTDVNMPGSMDGVKLAAYIRDRWPPIHLVVVSGRPVASGLPTGAKFLAKPFSQRELAEHVRSLHAG